MWRAADAVSIGAVGISVSAAVLAAVVATGCATVHDDATLVIPAATTARAAASRPSIFLPSGLSPDKLPTHTTAAAPVDPELLRAFLVVDTDFPRTGIHVTEQPDGTPAPSVELCAGHDPGSDFAAALTVGADIFTPSGNGIEVVAAYAPGMAENVLAAVTKAFAECARSAPITVGASSGTVKYSKVRLPVASSHPELITATRIVTIAGATYESGLAYARFGDYVVLIQLENINAKTSPSLLNRLLKPVVARHP